MVALWQKSVVLPQVPTTAAQAAAVGQGEKRRGAISGQKQVWSLTQFYSSDFLKSRIDVKKCVFYKRTIKVFISCC